MTWSTWSPCGPHEMARTNPLDCTVTGVAKPPSITVCFVRGRSVADQCARCCGTQHKWRGRAKPVLRRCLIRAWEQAGIARLEQVPDVVHARCGHSSPSGYITPHCHSARPVAHPFALWPCTATRPSGTGNRRYAKWPSLEYQQRLRVYSPSAVASYAHPTPLLHWWMEHLG